MRSNAPGLLPILRSRHLAEMLTLLLLHPSTEYTLSEVAGKLGLPLTTVQREASRLAGSGLINDRRVGRSRLVSANPASRYTRPLTELVSLAFGPEFVIGEEFGGLGALAVAIYGSWAAAATRARWVPRRTTSTSL
jgi:DNA-binding transcriptional ArsR family regulator